MRNVSELLVLSVLIEIRVIRGVFVDDIGCRYIATLRRVGSVVWRGDSISQCVRSVLAPWNHVSCMLRRCECIEPNSDNGINMDMEMMWARNN